MIALLLLAAAPVVLEQYDPNTSLQRADYEGRSLRELTLMRNMSYARAGNPFRRKWLNAWFSKQTWYGPLAQMDESRLTATMRANADAIGSYEASLSPDELLKRRDAVRARVKEKATPEDEIELKLLSVRLGG